MKHIHLPKEDVLEINAPITNRDGKTLTIQEFARTAIDISEVSGRTVRFSWSGITVTATSNDTPDGVVAQYESSLSAQIRQNPDHAFDLKRAQDQIVMDDLLAQLPEALTTPRQAVAFIGKLALTAEIHAGSRYDRAAVATMLEAAGYRSDSVTNSKTDPDMAAQFLVGAALRDLHKNHSPYHVFHEWAAAYAERFPDGATTGPAM